MVEQVSYSSLQIVIPIYNDWESIKLLIPLIDNQLDEVSVNADLLLIDDGSSQLPPESWDLACNNILNIRIVRLVRNLGHQRAICIALCHLRATSNCNRILIMDGDGEDSPKDIPRLLEELGSIESPKIVFAKRQRRSEGSLFNFFYLIYRILHLTLVGHRIRVGNFSVMSKECLDCLCTTPELWSHYAAAVFSTRIPYAMISTNRAFRISGNPKMNFTSLTMHGLSSLSVFTERISMRLMFVSFMIIAGSIVGLVAIIFIKLMTDFDFPVWTASAFAIFIILMTQFGTFMFTFCFFTYFTRTSSPFIPIRDYHYFLQHIMEVWHGSEK